tara:strand:- start:3205 stop:3384 length:180 start_codon:yes stop_codon:yes gene_type:complete
VTTKKLQISIPATHFAVIKQLADYRGSSVSGVAQEYLSRALAEHARKEFALYKEVDTCS